MIKPLFLDPKLKDDAMADAVVNLAAAISNIINLRDMTETLLLDRALKQCNEERAHVSSRPSSGRYPGVLDMTVMSL